MKKDHNNTKNGRIIMVNPGIHLFPSLGNVGLYPNNAIQILGTILHQNGFDVHIVDGRYLTVDDAVNEILDLISEDLVFIGFSVMTIQVTWAYFVSCQIKKKSPHVKIVWGGVHPTLFPEQTVLDDAIDLCIINECAYTIVEIANGLAAGNRLSNIPGLCYKENDGVHITSSNQVPDDFTNIPYIDFSIMNHSLYSRNNVFAIDSSINQEYKDQKVYPVNTSLGCNFKCNFCINVILERKYKMRTAEEIVERIEYLKSEYGANYIHMVDENFFGSKKRVYKFVELLRSRNVNIKWRPQLRADYFNKSYINEGFVKELEESGMAIAVMGVESASQRTLDLLNKKLKVESITTALEILSKTRVIPRLSFMVGIPGETEDDIKQTYKFAVTLKEKFPLCQPLVTPFRLFPGSEFYNLAVSKYGYKSPESLVEWVETADREYSESVGYQNPKNYIWVANAENFELRHNVFVIFRISSWYLSPFTIRKGLKSNIKYLIHFFLYKTSALRLKKDFCKLNVEYCSIKFLRKSKKIILDIIKKVKKPSLNSY